MLSEFDSLEMHPSDRPASFGNCWFKIVEAIGNCSLSGGSRYKETAVTDIKLVDRRRCSCTASEASNIRVCVDRLGETRIGM